MLTAALRPSWLTLKVEMKQNGMDTKRNTRLNQLTSAMSTPKYSAALYDTGAMLIQSYGKREWRGCHEGRIVNGRLSEGNSVNSLLIKKASKIFSCMIKIRR